MFDDMNEDTLSLEQAILERLAAPVKTKQGTPLVDDAGNPITATQAIAMSITQNAMRGDLAAASFIRNLTRKQGKADEDRMKEYAERKAKAAEVVRKQLKAEGLWTGQELELDRIAAIMVNIEDLEEQMQQPGYEDVITEYNSSGTATLKANPIHGLLDKYVGQLDQRLEKMRGEARMRLQRDRLLNRK